MLLSDPLSPLQTCVRPVPYTLLDYTYKVKLSSKIKMATKYVVGILSHMKNLEIAITRREKYHRYDKTVKVLIFVGDTSLETDFFVDNDKNVVYLKCKDDWPNIPHKIYLFYKYIYENYSDIKGLIKIDDNIDVNSSLLNEVISDIKDDDDYIGRVFNFNTPISQYIIYMNKTELYDAYPDLGKYNFWVGFEGMNYCSGNCYYLSKKALKIVVHNYDLFIPYPDDITPYLQMYNTNTQQIILNKFNIFEDKNVGKAMERVGIKPINSEKLLESLCL